MGCELEVGAASENFDSERRAGAGFPIFMSLGCGKSKGTVAGYWNLVLS